MPLFLVLAGRAAGTALLFDFDLEVLLLPVVGVARRNSTTEVKGLRGGKHSLE
jgi:hypothetical protein